MQRRTNSHDHFQKEAALHIVTWSTGWLYIHRITDYLQQLLAMDNTADDTVFVMIKVRCANRRDKEPRTICIRPQVFQSQCERLILEAANQ